MGVHAGDHFNSLVINRYKDGQVDSKVEMASYYSNGYTKTNNDSLYALNASGVSPRGFASFLIKNILVQDPNKDGTKFDPLDPDVTYVYSITVTIPNLRPTTRENRIELQVKGCVNGSVIENQTITLLCNATGKPIPNIRWMKNGEYYDGSSSVSSSNNALVFQQVAINDEGSYTCIADNGVGNPDKKLFTLLVKYKPKDTLLCPSKLDVCENKVIKLSCTADAYPSVKNYSLYNGNIYLGSSSNGQFTTTATPLGLNKFCCVASNEIGSSQCAFSDVYLMGDITTRCKINNKNTSVAAVKEGDKVVMQCDVSGNESYYMYQWVKVKDSLSVRNDTWQLTFGSINRTDEGYYQVTLRDKLNCSSQTRSFNITVNCNAFHFVQSVGRYVSATLENMEGDDVQLVCSANGDPPPDMMWIRNGSIRGMGSTLEINGVSKSDGGKYTFLSNNSLGYQVENIFVTVKLKIIAPEITNPYKQVILVDEGKDVSIVCNAIGYPVPNITWTKDGTVIGVGRIFNIARVKRNDSSCYTCTADNGIGHAKNASTCLDIHYPPSNIAILPSRRQMILKEGTSFSLYCQSDSNPPPTYTWKHNGGTLTDGQNGILVFNSIKRKQNGTYQCEAKNHLGWLLSVPIEIVVQCE
ncbi:hemicentin-1-like [Actinia tenebrosa]|uniref:Hemicentin-1-like n=1 Tax=Actinia tenebrosa TaxID=6105 RepID=A0A6P8HFK3_ACTTE|nr:hemicentin-1-like [Actinia tenebrosa]